MFKKRVKKEYPQGTFIPGPARIVCIIQLCLAFSLIFWQASQPFMGDLFRTKSTMLLYEDVMGINKHQSDLIKLENNKARFNNLPSSLKEKLLNQYLLIEKELHTSFKSKLKEVFSIFFIKMSPYELIWMALSIIIPIMLLKKVEGAKQGVWLIPVITLIFALDNRMYGKFQHQEDLYPTEKVLTEVYLKEDLKGNIYDQQTQLLKGWNLYLINEWLNDVPSNDPIVFSEQIEKGEFLFNLNILKNRTKEPYDYRSPISLFLLSLMIGWNFFLAWIIYKKT